MQVLELKHAVEGSLIVTADGDEVLIVVNWPFDLETDEWMSFSARLPLGDVLSVVSLALVEAGEHRIVGAAGSELAFRSKGDVVDLDVRAPGKAAPRFIHPVDEADLFGLRDALKLAMQKENKS